MMKIQIFSDLHLEFGDYDASIADDVDVVLFAGDVDVKQRSVAWLEQLHKNTHHSPYFLYICGNHEFYGQLFPSVIRSLKYKIKNRKIILLEKESVTINNVLFIGATLWTDFNLFEDVDLSEQVAAQTMNDYRKIAFYDQPNNQLRILRPADIAEYHQHSLDFIQQSLKHNHSERVVLMTHHAPSIQSVSEDNRDNPVYAAYASHLEHLCEHKDGSSVPNLWVHGHIHKSQDYYINQTHVIANPRGYAGYRVNPQFIPQCVIEI